MTEWGPHSCDHLIRPALCADMKKLHGACQSRLRDLSNDICIVGLRFNLHYNAQFCSSILSNKTRWYTIFFIVFLMRIFWLLMWPEFHQSKEYCKMITLRLGKIRNLLLKSLCNIKQFKKLLRQLQITFSTNNEN